MIEIEPGLLPGPGGDTVLWHVRCLVERARLEPALRAAVADIAALDGGWQSAFGLSPGDRNGPKFVSEPIALPTGYLIMVDFGGTPPELVQTAPSLIANRLTEAGVRDAVIGQPRRIGERHTTVDRMAPAAKAYLHGRLGRPFGEALRHPPRWLLQIAAQWLADHGPPVDPIGIVISAELPLTLPTLVDALAPALGMQTPVSAVATDFASVATAFTVAGGLLDTAPTATLTAAGDRDLVADLVSLRDVARTHAAELVWAGVGGYSETGHWGPELSPIDGLTDVLVPQATWYQVLSEGHLERLGGPPPGARALSGGRFELQIGEPEQWRPGHPDRQAVATRAHELLGRCLPHESMQIVAMRRERLAAARARDTEGLFRK